MKDIFDEHQDVLLSDLAKALPEQPSYKTIWRWANKGVRSQSGRIVKLGVVKLPSGLGSSLSKFEKFVNDLQE